MAIGPGGSQTLLATSRNSSPVVSYHGSPAGAALASSSSEQQANVGSNVASDAMQSAVVRGGLIRPGNRSSGNSDLFVLMDSDLYIDRSRALRDGIGAHLSSETSSGSGYIHAYGWSLPASSLKSSDGSAVAGKISTILGGTSAYGGSTDQLGGMASSDPSVKLSGLQVPIPQYCRPLTGDSLGMKIWCATAIDLSGGDVASNQKSTERQNQLDTTQQSELINRDPESSGSLVNISTSTPKKSASNQQALKDFEQEVDKALSYHNLETSIDDVTSRRPILKTTTEIVLSALPLADDSEELSTCVWICSTQHSRSKITIIDIKTKPNEMLDSFYVPTFLYCIKSIPGTKSGDLLGLPGLEASKDPQKSSITLNMIRELLSSQKKEFYKLIEIDIEAEKNMRQTRRSSVKSEPERERENSSRAPGTSQEDEEEENKVNDDEADAEISRILDNNISAGIATLQKLNDFVAHTQPQSSSIEGDEEQKSLSQTPTTLPKVNVETCQDATYYQPISTCLSTVWMGGKDSVLYIHSAIGQWKDCVAYVKLRDSILQICHFRGKVFVALADGSLCVFFRNIETKQWEFSQYLLLDINLMSEATNDAVDISEAASMDFQSKLFTPIKPTATTSTNETDIKPSVSGHSEKTDSTNAPQLGTTSNSKSRSKVAGIRCLEIANKNLWVGYKNRVMIIDPITLRLKHAFNVVPQVDNQVRQLISMRDGVFCCLRSDLILRLYSSLKPYQHIQNIDIEPVVSRLISPKTFVISHITAMKVADNVLWIGNAHGIILTIPCKLVPQISEAASSSQLGEFEESPSSLSIARFVPKCDITNAQVSFTR